MRKARLLWNEKYNVIAVADCSADLPKLYVYDDNGLVIEPVFHYPLSYLSFYGWVDLGEFA